MNNLRNKKEQASIFIFFLVGFLAFYMFMGRVGALFSLFFIENGAYITEQKKIGFDNSAFVMYLLWFVFCFLFFVFLVRYYLYPKIVRMTSSCVFYNASYFLLAIPIFYAVIVFSLGAAYGFPALEKVDRFIYWESAPKIFRFIYGQSFLVSFLAGLLLNYKKIFFSCFCIFLILLIHILMGVKFSGILFSLQMYFIGGAFFLCPWALRNLSKIACFVILLLMSVFVILYYQYSIVYEYGFDGALSAISARVVLQGHMFWGAVNIYDQPSYPTFEYLFKDIFNLISGDGYYGMKRLMLLVSPEVAPVRIAQGADFTMAYPAIYLLGLGYLGIFLIEFIVVFYFVFIVRVVALSLQVDKWFCLIPLGKILIDIFGFWGIGDINLLLGVKPLFYWLLFFVFYSLNFKGVRFVFRRKMAQ